MFTFPPEIEAYIQQKIAEGQFNSREEFALAAARAYQSIDEQEELLRIEIQAAIAEADAGLCEPMDIDAIKTEIIATIDESGQPKTK